MASRFETDLCMHGSESLLSFEDSVFPGGTANFKENFLSPYAVGVTGDDVVQESTEIGLAYDVFYDVKRYKQLKREQGERKAREMLAEEMAVDLLTHFGELGGESGRVGFFSYRYLIDQNGKLVEDAKAERPIREMFAGQEGVVAKLWLNWMIPFFEETSVGSCAFTLSTKRIGEFEGAYDYAYLFQKIDETEIVCFGLELDLSKEEQVEILNKQYKQLEQQEMFVTDNTGPDDMRGRAVFYSPNYFRSVTDAYSVIIGEVLEEMRGGYELASEEAVNDYIFIEEEKLENKKGWVGQLAEELLGGIVVGESVGSLQERLSMKQLAEVWKFDPSIIQQADDSGFSTIILPCGKVELNGSSDSAGFDLRSTSGDSYVEGEVKEMKCVTCPFCKKLVDAIVTEAKIKCPKCKKEVSK